MTDPLWGYLRPGGKIGIRNYVAVVSVMENANPTCRRVAASVRGTQAICSGFGGGNAGEDREQHLRTLINMGTSPNVYGAVVVSLFRSSAEEVAEAIAKSGRPVEAYGLEEDGGTLKTTYLACQTASKFSADTGRIPRAPLPWSELVIGVECGGSDGSSGIVSNPATGMVADMVVDRGGTVIMSEPVEMLGAEHLLAARAKDPLTRRKILDAVHSCVTYAQSIGVDLQGNNPNPDNIAGGLSTIEEKAIGAIKKGGSREVSEVFGYGFRPQNKGLVILDAPAPAVENITALSAAGAHAILFSTGKGNTIGNPISPTIKVCGNPYTMQLVRDNIDVDISAVLTAGMTLEEAARLLEKELIDVCCGKPTKADLLGETEVAISRIGRSL